MQDQRICIKFCVKNEFKCSEVVKMMQKAFGDSSMNERTIYKWFKRFEDSRESVEDDERYGRPRNSITDENVEKVRKIIFENRRYTIREVAEKVGLSYGSCESILTNALAMRRVAAKFVPKLLTFEQKLRRKTVAQEMLDLVADDSTLLQHIITGDETWVYGYDIETKAQSSEWKLANEPRPKKARRVRSNVKVLLTVFFDYHGIVFYEFLPQGATVNKEYYLRVLRRLREAIRRKRPDLWKEKSWKLHHDNAPPHTSILVRNFLDKNNTSLIEQPPYSPDLAPCDFFLFPKMKKALKGKHFETIEEIKAKSLEQLNDVPKEAFQKCFEDLKKRWHKCILSDGNYFEGDNIKIDY